MIAVREHDLARDAAQKLIGRAAIELAFEDIVVDLSELGQRARLGQLFDSEEAVAVEPLYLGLADGGRAVYGEREFRHGRLSSRSYARRRLDSASIAPVRKTPLSDQRLEHRIPNSSPSPAIEGLKRL